MIKGLSHIAVRCADLGESIRFYTKILGFEEAFRLCGDDGLPYLVYLWIAPGQFLELFPNGVREQERGKDVKGFQHLCLEADDAEAEHRRLSDLGVVPDGGVTTGKAGGRQFWIHDPDSNPIEIMEMGPQSMQSAADGRMRAQKSGRQAK